MNDIQLMKPSVSNFLDANEGMPVRFLKICEILLEHALLECAAALLLALKNGHGLFVLSLIVYLLHLKSSNSLGLLDTII